MGGGLNLSNFFINWNTKNLPKRLDTPVNSEFLLHFTMQNNNYKITSNVENSKNAHI